MKLTDTLLKAVKEEVTKAKEAIVDLPTPEEAAKVAIAKIEQNPIIKMAIEQAEFRKIKDLYHGFK